MYDVIDCSFVPHQVQENELVVLDDKMSKLSDVIGGIATSSDYRTYIEGYVVDDVVVVACDVTVSLTFI